MAALAAAGAASSSPSRPPAARFVSTSGTDAGACTRHAPCRTFNRAYHVAGAGQVVDIAGGRYADQFVEPDSRKASGKNVVFRPARGARVTVSNLDVDGASHIEFRQLTVSNGWSVKTGSSHITFRGVSGANFYVTSASDIRILGGSYGPQTDYDDAQIRSACMDASCARSRNILIDGVSFHDATISPGSDAHVECLQVWHTDNITIRDSKFRNCEHHSVFLAGEGSSVRGIVLENNWAVGVRSGYYSFRIAAGGAGEGCANVLFRNNSFTTEPLIECSSATNVQLVGNLGPYSRRACDDRYRYSHNVFKGAACSRSDKRVADPGFASAKNLHLRRGSPAVNRGDPRSFPTRDIDGQRRPRGRAPDAGADESR